MRCEPGLNRNHGLGTATPINCTSGIRSRVTSLSSPISFEPAINTLNTITNKYIFEKYFQ